MARTLRPGSSDAQRILAMKEIWTRPKAKYAGEFVKFDELMQWPKPVQKPHPPIIIGGGFPQAAKRAIAYGDGWMPIGGRADPLEVLPQFREWRKMLAVIPRRFRSVYSAHRATWTF